MKLSKEYKEITSDILNDEHFLELKNYRHHGTNRYDHCKRVSHVSFLLAKILKANVDDAVKAGLLHDFFLGSSSQEENSYLNHPKKCAENAKEYFNINDFEANIIETHMYHYALTKKVFPFINRDAKVNAKEYKPTSREGKIVCLADLIASIYEVGVFKVRYSVCLYLLFVFNIIRY